MSCSLLQQKSIANMAPKMTIPITVASRIICQNSIIRMFEPDDHFVFKILGVFVLDVD